MNQLAMTFDAPRARRRDPATSHKAAARAKAFAPSHAMRILEVLRDEDLTAQEISQVTGLTVVQICRRLPEIEGAKTLPFERDGFRVWTVSTLEKTKPAASTAGL